MSIKENFLKEVSIGDSFSFLIGTKEISGEVIALDLDTVKIRKENDSTPTLSLDAIIYYEKLTNTENKLHSNDNINSPVEANINVTPQKTQPINQDILKDELFSVEDIIRKIDKTGGYTLNEGLKTRVRSLEETIDKISQIDLKKDAESIKNSIDYAFKMKETAITDYKISQNINKLKKLTDKYPNSRIPYDLLACISYKCKAESMAMEYYKKGTDNESGFLIAKDLNKEEDLDLFAVRHITGTSKLNPEIILYAVKRMVNLKDYSPIEHIKESNPDNIPLLSLMIKTILKINKVEYSELFDYDSSITCFKQLLDLALTNIKIKDNDSLYVKYGTNFPLANSKIKEIDYSSTSNLPIHNKANIPKTSDVNKYVSSKIDYYQLAKEAEQFEKDFSKAISYYKDAIKHNYRLSASVPDLVSLYNRLEMYDEGLDCLEKNWKKSIDKAKYLNLRHMIFSKSKNPKYADLVNKNMEELIALPSTTREKKIELQVYRAAMFSQMKKYKESLEFFLKCLSYCERKFYSSEDKYKHQKIQIFSGLCNAYFKLNEIENAKHYAQKVLDIIPSNQFALSILNDTYGDVDETDEPEEIYGNLHLYTVIKDKLDKLSLEPEIKNKKLFNGDQYIGNEENTKRIVEGISYRTAVNEESKGNSYLAASKLIKIILEKEHILDTSFFSEKKYYDFIGRSCLAFGNAEIYNEEVNLDTARSFFIQTMDVYRDEDKFNKQLGIATYRYIQSLFCSIDEIKQDERTKNDNGKMGIASRLDSFTDLEKELRKILSHPFSSKFTSFAVGIIDFLRYNKRFKNIIFDYINSEKCPTQVINVFESIIGKKIINQGASFDIEQYWESLIQSYIQKRNNLNKAIEKVISSIPNLGELRESLDFLKSCHIEEILNYSDENKLKALFSIFDNILKYNESNLFNDKEDYLRRAEDQSNNLVEKIQSSPTYFSYEKMIPELMQIQAKIFKESKELFSSFKPEITIQLENGFVCSVDESSRTVKIPVSFINKSNSQNADDLSIEIKGDDVEDFSIIQNTKLLSGSGRSQAELIEVKVSPQVLKTGLLSLEIKVNYKYRISMTEFQKGGVTNVIQVPLSKDKDFVPIENKFEIYRNGAEVKDKSMFFGRDEEISQIIRNICDEQGNIFKGRCLALYGQTRTGKSSLLYHLEERLREKNEGRNIIIHLGSIGSQSLEGDNITSFLYSILETFERELKKNHREIYDQLISDDLKIDPDILLTDEEHSMIHFNSQFKKVTDHLDSYSSNYNIIITVDEFTYIYDWIRKGSMTDRFMKFWKAFIQNNSVFAIIIGQDHMMKFIQDKRFTNDFGSTDPRKVSYLTEEHAKRLMYEPISNTENCDKNSRYQESALERLYELTSGSAYLIMILCAGLVDYLNENKVSFITLAHVEDYLRKNLYKFSENYFEPQYQDKSEIDSNDLLEKNKKMLLKIAQYSNNKEWTSLRTVQNSDDDAVILRNLELRDVIEINKNTQCKIKVSLYKEWLLDKYGTERIYE